MKVVINKCYGGFDISKEAKEELKKLGVEDPDWTINRTDPRLIEVVEKLGKLADGDHAKLKIVEIPDDVDWYIDDYDGVEWVAETHRTWE